MLNFMMPLPGEQKVLHCDVNFVDISAMHADFLHGILDNQQNIHLNDSYVSAFERHAEMAASELSSRFHSNSPAGLAHLDYHVWV